MTHPASDREWFSASASGTIQDSLAPVNTQDLESCLLLRRQLGESACEFPDSP